MTQGKPFPTWDTIARPVSLCVESTQACLIPWGLVTNVVTISRSEKLKSYSNYGSTHMHSLFYLHFPPPIFLSLKQKNSLTSHGQHSCPTGCKHRSGWSQWRDESLHNSVIYTCLHPPFNWDLLLEKEPFATPPRAMCKEVAFRGESNSLGKWVVHSCST